MRGEKAKIYRLWRGGGVAIALDYQRKNRKEKYRLAQNFQSSNFQFDLKKTFDIRFSESTIVAFAFDIAPEV